MYHCQNYEPCKILILYIHHVSHNCTSSTDSNNYIICDNLLLYHVIMSHKTWSSSNDTNFKILDFITKMLTNST